MSKESCPFCVNAEVKDRFIYEDDLVIVFPTQSPIVPGHILICPKRHVSKQDDLTNEELLDIFEIVKKMKIALNLAFQAEGFNIAWNEGGLAGQTVPHLHIHLLPRTEGDTGIYSYEPREFLYRPGSREKTPQDELLEVSKLIKNKL